MTSSVDASTAALAQDSRGLESLKARARQDPKAAAKAAATQFEAMFLQQMLSQMRQALPGTDPLASGATQMQTSLLDQQLAQKLAARGTGLGAAIAKQLEARMGKVEPQAPAPTMAPTTPLTPSKRREVAPLQAKAASPANEAKETFVGRVLEHARAAAESLGVPVANIVGQAALESAWGKREIPSTDGKPTHNLFGIKADARWTGRTVDATTTEVIGGVARRVVQKFRAYDSYGDAFKDYAKLLASNPRYEKVVGAADAKAFAQGLQRGGYATDPAYAAKLQGVIASATRAVERVAANAQPERLA